MTTRKIGIPISKLGESSIGLALSYLMFASQFGEPVLLLPDGSVREDLDLLLLQGGADVDSSRYGEFPGYFTGKPDLHKEYFDVNVLPKYIELGVPIAGICRGEQSLAVHFNAKLIQHMQHETNKPEDPYKCVHKVNLDPLNFWNWKEYTNKLTLDVNSRHHQVVSDDNFPDCLTVIGRHKDDKSIEIFCHNTLPIIGLQAHPEDIYDKDTNDFVYNIIDRIIETRKSILIDE